MDRDVNGKRITYPRLAGELVDSVNALSSCGALSVPSPGEPRWSVRPVPPDGPYRSRLALVVTVGGSPVRLHLDGGAVEAAVGELIAVESFEALDPDLKMAVLEYALEAPLRALGEALDARVALQGVPGEGSGAAGDGTRGLRVAVHGPEDEVRCTVMVEPDAPLPESVQATLARFRPSRDFGEVPVRVTFEAGCASVAQADLRDLAPGDIVLFDRCYVADDRLRVNVCGSEFLMGRLAGRRVTVEEDPSVEESA